MTHKNIPWLSKPLGELKLSELFFSNFEHQKIFLLNIFDRIVY